MVVFNHLIAIRHRLNKGLKIREKYGRRIFVRNATTFCLALFNHAFPGIISALSCAMPHEPSPVDRLASMIVGLKASGMTPSKIAREAKISRGTVYLLDCGDS
jgi:hypothetical protein